VVELIVRAWALGWPVLVMLVGLLIYFQATIKDPEQKKRATFQTMIGILCMFLVFIAVSNYTHNFAFNDGMLPVSLVMITIMAFIGGLYFPGFSALMKIGGFMFLWIYVSSGSRIVWLWELVTTSRGRISSSSREIRFCQYVPSTVR
jgi:hypothetical protein